MTEIEMLKREAEKTDPVGFRLERLEVFNWGTFDGLVWTMNLGGKNALLMDRDTLLNHRQHWIMEPQPEKRDLLRLTDAENQLYNDLRHDSFGPNIRLEQEMIGFAWIEAALKYL
jgi:hypothetical protein